MFFTERVAIMALCVFRIEEIPHRAMRCSVLRLLVEIHQLELLLTVLGNQLRITEVLVPLLSLSGRGLADYDGPLEAFREVVQDAAQSQRSWW